MLSAKAFAPVGATKVPARNITARATPEDIPNQQLVLLGDQTMDEKVEIAKKLAPQYPHKPTPKDRSGEFAARLAGCDKITQCYLDGSLPADYGFDPLHVFRLEPEISFLNPYWLRHSEVFHGRWAMLGAAGIMGQDILGRVGAIPPETNLLWWQTGVIPPLGYGFEFWAEPWGLFWIEVWMMQFAELKRYGDYKNPGSQAKQWFLGVEGWFEGAGSKWESVYPGGPFFNFMGMAKGSAEETRTMRTKEINNGRLAMLAMLGFFAQACMTGKSPIDNLFAHLEDAVHNNAVANLTTASTMYQDTQYFLT